MSHYSSESSASPFSAASRVSAVYHYIGTTIPARHSGAVLIGTPEPFTCSFLIFTNLSSKTPKPHFQRLRRGDLNIQMDGRNTGEYDVIIEALSLYMLGSMPCQLAGRPLGLLDWTPLQLASIMRCTSLHPRDGRSCAFVLGNWSESRFKRSDWDGGC